MQVTGMRKEIRVAAASLIGLGLLYCCGPIVAGVFEIGDRQGPRLYPEEFHLRLYDLACQARTGQKPESPLRSVLYNRPLFYGQERSPKPIGERYAILANFEVRKLATRDKIREWNLEIDKETHSSRDGALKIAPEPAL